MPDTSLANLPYTEPPSDAQYRRAARTLARYAGDDTEALREVLQMIGYPGAEPAPSPRPRVVTVGRQRPRCGRGLHDMVPENVTVDSSGRRCRACRNESKRLRERGEK